MHFTARECLYLMHFLIHLFFKTRLTGVHSSLFLYVTKIHIIIPGCFSVLFCFFFFWKNGGRTQLHNETVLVWAKRPVRPERCVDRNEWPAECFWGSTNNGPELCMFACVLVRPCVQRGLRPARPHLAHIVSPAQTLPSSETLVIIEGSRHFCSCFCKELTRRHHAAAIRKSRQEPLYRG